MKPALRLNAGSTPPGLSMLMPRSTISPPMPVGPSIHLSRRQGRNAPGFHIYFNHARRLCRINQQRDAFFLTDTPDLCDGLNRADDIGCVCNNDESV